MEVQEGFIVGIFNYCDRWCETCRFTSRCRLFADRAEHEAGSDPALKAVIEAPPHPRDVHEPPRWMIELIKEMNEAAEAALAEPPTTEDLIAPFPAADAALSRRTKDYAFAALQWLQRQPAEQPYPVTDPHATISWFSTMIASKTYRALCGRGDESYGPGEPRDCDGSAKVAVLGIERSLTAWRDLVAVGAISDGDAGGYVSELRYLRSELLSRFPRALAFVRPGFDQPDEVKMLEASGY